jgi:hypothetical protein
VPTITLEGDANGAPHPDPSSYVRKFSGPHAHRTMTGAFATDEGERLGEVTAGSRDSVLGTAQVALQYPTPDGAATATEYAIDPAKLHDVFAADVPAQHDLPARRRRRRHRDRGGRDRSPGRRQGGLAKWAAWARGVRSAQRRER